MLVAVVSDNYGKLNKICGEKTFMIKQEEIEVYLKNGYVLGKLKFNSN